MKLPIQILLALAVLPFALFGENLPSFSLLRFDEDSSAYREFADSGNTLLGLKYIPLGYREEAHVSIGGSIRQRYDHGTNPDFGAAPFDISDAWLQRYTMHLDGRWHPRFRTFVQILGGFSDGREGGPGPVDETGIEIYNAFVDLTLSEGVGTTFLRLGRQELRYGSGRLIDVREGPIVRQTYNAGLLRYESELWKTDAFYAIPIRPERGSFNDDENENLELWGLYATRKELPLSGSLDLYYLGYVNDTANHLGLSGEEERHSLGLRYFGQANGWDWNFETIYQFGDFRDLDISAWTFASITGYTFEDVRWKPRLGLNANVASGDDDPNDGTLGSFNAIFPRGSYFSEAGILGPRNFFNLRPQITLQPTDRLAFTVDTKFFWRLETEDGVYTPQGREIRAASGSDERFVAQTYSLGLEYEITRELSFEFIYTHFTTGDFLDETGPSEDIDFFEATLNYTF